MQEFNIKDVNIFPSISSYLENKNQLSNESIALAPMSYVKDLQFLGEGVIEVKYSDGTMKHTFEEKNFAEGSESFVVDVWGDGWILYGRTTGFMVIGVTGYYHSSDIGEIYFPFSLEDFEHSQIFLQAQEPSTSVSAYVYDFDYEQGTIYYEVVDSEGNVVPYINVSAIFIGRYSGVL